MNFNKSQWDLLGIFEIHWKLKRTHWESFQNQEDPSEIFENLTEARLASRHTRMLGNAENDEVPGFFRRRWAMHLVGVRGAQPAVTAQVRQAREGGLVGARCHSVTLPLFFNKKCPDFGPRIAPPKCCSALHPATSVPILASLAFARMELPAMSRKFPLSQVSSSEWPEVVTGNFIQTVEKYRAFSGRKSAAACGGTVGIQENEDSV